MNSFWNRHNLFYRLSTSGLIILHLFTFSPIKDALAFTASSASYRLNSGTLSEGGNERSVATPTYTKLLLHNDGTNGSTIFTDEIGKAVTANGNAQIDTTQSKFGSASALFDGNGDYLSLPDSENWNFGSGDFTIEARVRFATLPVAAAVFDFIGQWSYADNQRAWRMGIIEASGSYKFGFQYSTDGTASTVNGFNNVVSVAVDTWYHFAIVRSGNNIYFFFDGVKIYTLDATGADIFDSNAILSIGAQNGTESFMNGWLDELRISKGIARWTANFTPPQEPYSAIEPVNPNPSAPKLWQDALGEPSIGQSQSASYILNSGLIPTIQSNPPVQTQIILNQSWKENSSKPDAFDLDDYFSSDVGALTYTVSGNLKIAVSINPTTNKVSFSQPQAWFGTEKISFIALDSEGNSIISNQVTLQVEGVDNPPVLAFIPDITVNETELVTITPNATDLDGLPGVPITYSFTAPLNSQGQWQTDYTSSGTYTITVTATDSTGLIDTQTVIINVRNVNRAPVLNPLSDITANEGDLVTVTPVVSDPDNDALSLYYTAPLDSTGKWLTDYDSVGTYTVTVTASDGIDTVSQTFNIIVNNTNRAPQATLSLSKYTVNPNEEIAITLIGSDPDGDSLTFSLKKDGVEIASGSITSNYNTTTSFSTLGDHIISATITDSGGKSTTDSKGVDVADPNANRDSINPVMGDFNGDALSDLGLHNSDTGTWEICISDAGVFRNAVDWLPGFGTSRDWWPMGGDFNGDGKTDVAIYNNTTGQLQVALSSGSGFSNSGTWLTASFASYSWQATTGNFNADKYTDLALYNKDTGEVKVALGTGSSFASFNTWLNNFGADYIAMSGDFNGDSLSDLCLFKKSSGEFKIAFSNSKEFVDGTSWFSGFAVDKDPLISDFNNDGLTDIGYWDKSNGSWYYAISTGSAFVNKGVWLSNFGTALDESASTGDFDGNGVTDAACFDRDQIGINRWKVSLSSAQPTDLLTEVDNGIGGKTQITYTYAAKSENNLLPFPVYVASTISLLNTFPADRNATYTQNFIFSGGYYDATEREFRGFEKVRVTDPITNNYTETYFYQGKPTQDGALKGQIEKILAYDGNARKISETLNTYEVRKAGPQERFLGFPMLIEQTTTVYEENATYLTAKDKFTYDNIGNLLDQISEGDASKIGDEKSTATIYAQAYEIGTSTGLSAGFNRPLETLLKDKDGNTVSRKTFEYDTKGNLIKDTIWIFDPLTSIVSRPSSLYSYDSFGNLTSTTNALGSTVITDYETDFYAYPQKITNSLGHSITYVYDPKFGVVTSVTDANGVITTTTYDSLARPIRGTKDDGGGTQVTAVTYSYPDFNTKVSTNALGFSSTEYIDGLGRKYRTVSVGEDGILARQVSTEVFFNNRGLTEKESLPHYIDESPAQVSYVRYEYDIRGRIKKTISDFPGTLRDAESSINYITPLYVETTDPQGNRKGTLKDVFGNIIEVTEFTQGGVYKTLYTYDIQNNLIQTQDAQGNITQIVYDSIGRKLRMTDPDMGTWLYEYDLIGNLIKQTDAKGQILEFTYDALNRLSAKRYPLSANPAVEYFYDDSTKPNCIGRLSKVTYQSGLAPSVVEGSTEFFYDKLGREIKSIKSVESRAYSVERQYDILDRLTKLTYPDGEEVSYSYDANSGLLESIRSTLSAIRYVQDITYNAQAQIKTIQYGNNTQTNYTYGQDLRLSRILTQGSSTLQDLNYQFDKNGNITTLTDNLRSNIRTYAYDDLDRLTQAQNVPSPSGGYTNFNYQYDSIGNMTYKSDVGVMQYGEGLTPQGTVPKPHALTKAGGYTYQYDANGNMTQGKNKTLSYDIENRLIQVNELGTITSFAYDGDGGRVKLTTGNGQLTTIYIGSLFEITSQPGQADILKKHIFSGANRVCTVTKDEARGTTDASYYHSDHLGSSSVITDASGNQVERYEYTPYGTLAVQELVSRPSSLVRHLYTGKELDATGLYFYGARYYDPELGRFISADTIVQAPYDPQSLNRYSYCRNNPINYTDPTGHKWSWKKFWHAAVGAFVGVALAIVLGPAGLAWYGVTMSWAIGGAVGGAITGGLEGGWKGALIGGAMGGALGGFGGWASGIKNGGWIIGGMFAGGAGYAGATDSWDSFAGGIVGGLAGTAVGSGINNSELVKNWKAGNDNKYHSGQPSNGAKDGNANKTLIVDKGKGASGDPIIDDPEVRAQMLKAYNESLDKGTEQGGLVLKNKTIVRYPQENTSQNSVMPIFRPGAVADFHTHFHTQGVFGPDYRTAATNPSVYGLKHYVVDSESIKSYMPTIPGEGKWEHVWKWDGE